MKNKISMRIGMWNTPPCIRKCLTSLKALTLLLVMLMSVNLMAAVTAVSASGIESGKSYVIVATYENNDYLLKPETFSAKGSTAASFDASKVSASDAWLFTKSGDTWTIKLSTGEGLYFTNDNNGVACAQNKGASFTIAATAAGATTSYLTASDGSNTRYLALYQGSNWRCYKNTNNGVPTIQLYSISSTPPSGKDVTITAESELNLTFEESDGTINVTYGEDVADKEVNLFSDASCTTPFSGDWFDAELNSTTGNIDYIAEANTGAAREAYIQIYVMADDAETENTKVIKVTQEEYKEPTGTFEKFTEDLEEGDYVICVGTDAMKNSVTSNRLDYASVTVSSDKITNPDASVIWHIASVSEGVWSIFNVVYDSDKGGYAAGTGTKNQAGILAATTDVSTETKAQWTCAKVTNGYNFENVANKVSNVNSKLQKNGTYGFACYAAFSDIVLYKKEVAPTNEAVTFAAPEGGTLVIKNGATPISSGTTIQDETVLDVTFGMNTPEAYKDVAIKVTKTEGGDDVTSTVYNSETKKITMPRYAITVAVTSTKLYKITLTTDGEGTGSATMNGKTTDIYVDGETQIDLVANAVAPNEFTKWSATENISINEDDKAETYALASGDGTITATFGISSLQPLDQPTLSDPTNITYSGVTLNWQELDNAKAYNVELLLNDETVASDVIYETSWTPEVTLQANTTYTYTVQGVGDGTTYADENNPKAQSTVTTADYPAVVLTLSENGNTTPVNGKLNTPITLPTVSTQACDGKVFMGWSENTIDGEVGKDQVSLLDATYTFNNPSVLTKTIYAVYAKKTEGAAQTIFSEDFDACEGTGGNTGGWSGSIASATLPSSITGWKFTKGNAADQCAKFGSSSAAGSVQTPALGFTGKATLTFRAGAWSGDAKTLNITTTSGTVTPTSVTLADAAFTSYEIVITDATENPQITIAAAQASKNRFFLDDVVVKAAGESTYSNYCTTCQAAVAAPTFSLEGGNYSEAKTLILTATEGAIYYTINGGTETLYEEEIVLDNRGTYEISAYAKVDERTSETVTKTYTLSWAYTLAELVAEGEPTSTGRTVTVILTNEIIESLATSGNYVNGFFTMVGDKKIEVYCKNSPSEWEVGGKVSGTVTCPWKLYSSTWELCPENWNWVTNYTAPAKIESLEITGDVTNKNYTAGQKLDFTGLTVTGVYSDATEENVTADVVWTEVTLTENQPEATATATLNNAKTGNVAVNASKTITGLTVGAKVELSKIEITKEASKKDFFVGRNFNHDGIVVTATYSNGSTSNVTNACDFSTPTLVNKGQETVTITYSEGEGQDKKEVTTSYTINVKYMNLSELVAEDVPTNTSVKVAFSDVEITGFYTNKSSQRTGVYVNVKGKNNEYIELYSSGTPSETLNGWQAGGKLASKGDYITGTWKYYDGGSVWEIDFGSNYAWSTNIEYTAPVIYPTAVALSETTATVKQSKSLDLEANFIPTNATVLNNLEWSSDNTQVTVAPSQDKKSAKVTVASDATVGTATITVKVDDKDGNELSATCVITIEEYSVPHYGLYAGDITEGDYIFKADGKNYFMNNTNNNGRLANVANENYPDIVNNIITTDADAYVWQIAKSGDYWTIKNLATQTYVVSTASGKASLSDSPSDNTEKWTITYDETNEIYTFENLGRSQASSDKDKKYLRNNDGNGWACYASGTGNAITLYKDGFTPAAALTSIEIQGTLDITEYFKGKSVKYDGLSVLGHYSDGGEAAITDGITWSADPATFTVLGAQTVTITATVQTKTGEVSGNKEFNVTVVESHQINYGLVTSVNTLYDGAVVVLGAVYEKDGEPIYAVNQGFYTSNYKYLLAYRSNTENSDLEYENEVMKTANASEITLKKVENGWLLIDENNNYICGAADLSKTTKVEDATIWTISIADGKAVIAASDYQFFYNKNSGAERFKTYASSTSTQEPVGIYMKNLVAVRTGLTAGKIATYCEAKGASIYDGAAFFDILNKDANSKNVTLQEALSLSAGMPYIIEPTHNILKVVFKGDAVTDALNNNGLYGWLGGQFDFSYKIDEKEAYFVSGGRIVRCGDNCTLLSNRAYVVLEDVQYEGVISPIPGRRCIRLATEGSAVATGCEDALYISNDNELKKVVVDGQFFIIRNGKVFDAQGKLVK